MSLGALLLAAALLAPAETRGFCQEHPDVVCGKKCTPGYWWNFCNQNASGSTACLDHGSYCETEIDSALCCDRGGF